MTKKKKKQKLEDQSLPDPSKRSFFNKLWAALGIVALAELVGVVFVFLRTNKDREASGKMAEVIEAGPAEGFALNSVTAFIQGKFYLCRLEDGGFLAVSRKCTHLGCTVPWVDKEKRFACPCHASEFNIKGEVVNDPAPRALDIYPLYIENNIIKVDVGKQIKRSSFHSDQVVYAEKEKS